MTDHYVFADGVGLSVAGMRPVRRHFAKEYGPAAARGAPAEGVTVLFDRRQAQGPTISGSYKTLRWKLSLSDASASPLQARIALVGRPRWFGLSLLQGWFVEPLISMACARAGHVLLPAAAFDVGGEALLLLGRSGTGKTSLSARSLAAARPLLGDDQVIVGPDGCRSFPRRLRLYSDVAVTAPSAHAMLGRRRRASLAARRAALRVSGGVIQPPLHVEAEAIGPVSTGPLRVGRLVLLERGDVASVQRADLTAHDVVPEALRLLDLQRARLPRTGGWLSAMESVRRDERDLLHGALAGARIERIVVPERWLAETALSRLESVLHAR